MAGHRVFQIVFVSLIAAACGHRVDIGKIAAKLYEGLEAEVQLRGQESQNASSDALVDPISEAAVDSLDWLNALLTQIWPQTTVAINKIVQNTVNPQLAASLPGPLASMKVQEFALPNAPTFGPIKVYKSSNGLKLKLGMKFSTDEPITVKAFNSDWVSVGINHMSVSGDLIVHLAPIIDSMPVVGGARVYFAHPPEIRFDLGGLANIGDIPGASGLVRSTIDSAVANMLVLPNCFGIPVATPAQGVDPSFFEMPEAIALVRITVLSASDLHSKDWALVGKAKSDPYVIIKTSDRSYSTPVVANSLNPVWAEGNLRDFVIYDQEQTVQFTMFDEDDFSGNDLMGDTRPYTFQELGSHTHNMALRDPDGGSAGTLKAKFEHLKFAKCDSTANGALFFIQVHKIVMPASVATSASAVFTLAGESKSTANGHMPVTVDAVLNDIVERMYAKGMANAEIAELTGLSEEQVTLSVKKIAAERGEYHGGAHLHIGSKLYFPNPKLDLMAPSPMNLKIVDEGGNDLAEQSIDLSELHLLDGIGSRAGCVAHKSLLLPHESGAKILIHFDVHLFTIV